MNSLWSDRENTAQLEAIHEYFTIMVQELTEKYKRIRSIFVLENTGSADIVAGNAICLYGDLVIEDEILGKRFEIQPKSFFQVNTL